METALAYGIIVSKWSTMYISITICKIQEIDTVSELVFLRKEWIDTNSD